MSFTYENSSSFCRQNILFYAITVYIMCSASAFIFVHRKISLGFWLTPAKQVLSLLLRKSDEFFFVFSLSPPRFGLGTSCSDSSQSFGYYVSESCTLYGNANEWEIVWTGAWCMGESVCVCMCTEFAVQQWNWSYQYMLLPQCVSVVRLLLDPDVVIIIINVSIIIVVDVVLVRLNAYVQLLGVEVARHVSISVSLFFFPFFLFPFTICVRLELSASDRLAERNYLIHKRKLRAAVWPKRAKSMMRSSFVCNRIDGKRAHPLIQNDRQTKNDFIADVRLCVRMHLCRALWWRRKNPNWIYSNELILCSCCNKSFWQWQWLWPWQLQKRRKICAPTPAYIHLFY